MKVISIDPEIMHGTPCFAGTRVPIDTLFAYLPNVEAFHQGFPTVERYQVVELLKQMPAILAKVPPHVLLTS